MKSVLHLACYQITSRKNQHYLKYCYERIEMIIIWYGTKAATQMMMMMMCNDCMCTLQLTRSQLNLEHNAKVKPTCLRKTNNSWSPWSHSGGWKDYRSTIRGSNNQRVRLSEGSTIRY